MAATPDQTRGKDADAISNPTPESLQHLIDESAIRSVLARYSRAIDRLDWDLLRSCYHPDAIDAHGDAFSGDIEAYIAWLQEELPAKNDWTMHFLGTQLIEIDGDVAWAETYCLALHRLRATATEPARDKVRPVRYCDRLERREAEWRIAHRVVVYEPGRVDPLSDELLEPSPAGARDRSDPAYRRTR